MMHSMQLVCTEFVVAMSPRFNRRQSSDHIARITRFGTVPITANTTRQACYHSMEEDIAAVGRAVTNCSVFGITHSTSRQQQTHFRSNSSIQYFKVIL